MLEHPEKLAFAYYYYHFYCSAPLYYSLIDHQKPLLEKSLA